MIIRAVAIGMAAFLALTFVMERAVSVPRSSLILASVFTIAGMSLLRIATRTFAEKSLWKALVPFRSRGGAKAGKRLIVVGEVERIASVLRNLSQEDNEHYQVVGVLTSDENLTGLTLGASRVLGTSMELFEISESFRARDEAIEAILFVSDIETLAGVPTKLLGALRRDGCLILRLPRINELTGDEPASMGLREISIEELLSRAPIALDAAPVVDLLRGMRVMVTGAGGSIGSELCRQIAALGCVHMTLVEASEFNLFEISREIALKYPQLSHSVVLANIRDRAVVDKWMAAEKPDLVFHAAALKHVGLVEEHPGEGCRHCNGRNRQCGNVGIECTAWRAWS